MRYSIGCLSSGFICLATNQIVEQLATSHFTIIIEMSIQDLIQLVGSLTLMRFFQWQIAVIRYFGQTIATVTVAIKDWVSVAFYIKSNLFLKY